MYYYVTIMYQLQNCLMSAWLLVNGFGKELNWLFIDHAEQHYLLAWLSKFDFSSQNEMLSL